MTAPTRIRSLAAILDKRSAIIGTIGAGLLGLALVLTLSWLLSRTQISAFRSHLSGLRSQPSAFSSQPLPGLDTGLDAIKLAEILNSSQLPALSFQLSPFSFQLFSARWMRLRGIDLNRVPETRVALQQLRHAGLRTCVFLRRPVKDWKVAYLPDDLRETYENGRQLGAAFGDLVDAWEVDNEPDLGFVPESAERYTAFLKASYLGLQRGFAEAKLKPETRDLKPESLEMSPDIKTQPSALSSQLSSSPPQVSGFKSQVSVQAPLGSLSSQPSGLRSQTSAFAQAPLVLMGSLGLPPGPWLERFAANDGFAYTDGYNYHYYGYAEDFTDVYRQHERAAKELTTARVNAETGRRLGADGEAKLKAETGKLKAEGAETKSASGPKSSGFSSQPSAFSGGQPATANPQLSAFSSQLSANFSQKSLPIFLTEIGYGMLGKEARDMKEGRLRQWRWFKSVGEQVAQLRIEAPMAFYLPPYLEYGISEYGLTVPAKQETEKAERWIAGGIEYTPSDFQVSGFKPQVSTSEPWMSLIGSDIGGNQATPALAWWFAETKLQSVLSEHPQLSALSSQLSAGSRAWSVTTVQPSPIVLDFLPGDGLHPLKRFNGIFVTGNVPPGTKPEEAKPVLPPMVRPSPPPKPPRSEEFMIHVRAQSGNLYEVYPTRQATPEWQHFLEPHDNFTMSFYGRAELPWHFNENKPASLVVVMYPKALPATYEFRRVQLLRLGKPQKAETGDLKPEIGNPQNTQLSALSSQLSHSPSQLSKNARYGAGRIILYNFSDKPVTGRLHLPDCIVADAPRATSQAQSAPSSAPAPSPLPLSAPPLTLAPGERRVIEVAIQVPGDHFERTKAEILFIPDPPLSADSSSLSSQPSAFSSQPAALRPQVSVFSFQLSAFSPQVSPNVPARFRTDFFPALEGIKTEVVANLLRESPSGLSSQLSAFLLHRPRASEEAPMLEQSAKSKEQGISNPQVSAFSSQLSGFPAFAQPGAQVSAFKSQLSDTFIITITSLPPGKSQRIEVEIPWPDGLDFPEDAFLSLEYRLQP